MRRAVELLGVALAGLRFRRGRAGLMAVGPFVGVVVIVGAFGVLQSTTGELRTALERLGTELIVVQAGQSEDVHLPAESADRVRTVPTVEAVTAMGSVGAMAYAAPSEAFAQDPIANQVRTADSGLLTALETTVAFGRPLSAADEATGTTAAMVGAEVARVLGVERGRLQTVYVGSHAFSVVGVLEPSVLRRDLDFAVFIPSATAQRLFGADPRPNELLVRVDEGTIRQTARLLATVITLGGPGSPVVTIPADLLSAQAEIDRTLVGAIWGLGLLAILVGGFGITNVMLISVLERRREIGIRRALGHLRSLIAGQFIVEATLVGFLGGLAGAGAGAIFVMLVARLRGWVAILDPWILAGAVTAAVVVTTLAGVYPAIRAARLEPLDALRAD